MGRLTAAIQFTGRGHELGEIRSLLEQTRARRGVAVAVTGEPGIGKTRLCEEALSLARSTGFLVCRTEGHPLLSGVPLALVSGLLRNAFDQLSPGERASISSGLPALESIMALSQADDAQGFREAAVFDAVAEFCKRLCSRRPVVACLDRFEAADEPSVRLTAALIDRLARHPLLLLISTRRGQTALHFALAAELGRSGRVIHLERLAKEDSEALVKLARPDLTAFDHHALVNDCEGLPSYLAGALGEASGGPVPSDPPQVMRSQLDGLWAQLSEPAREMVRLLAVAGGAIPEGVLLRLWPEAETFTAVLREIVDAELAVWDSTGTLLSHPSYGRILRGRMFDHERREYHRRLAAVLGADAQPASRPALADHLLEISDEIEPEALRKALTEASATPGVTDERLCLYLVRTLAILPSETDLHIRSQLYSKLGAAQQRLGKPELARASWKRAMDDSLRADDPAVHQFGAAQTQLAFHEWETGSATEADSRRYDPCRAALHMLIWTTRYGTREQNLDAAHAAIRLREATPSGAALAELGNCFIAWTHGRYEDARRHALAACRTANGEDIRSIARITLSRIAPLTGDIENSFEAVRALADTTASFGLSYGECATRSWAALTQHLAGNLVAAEEQLGPAVMIAAKSGAAPVIARISLLMALLQAERGDLKAATASLADAQRVRGETVWQADLEGLQALARGVVALQAGKPEQVPRELPLTAGNYPVLTLILPFHSGLAGLQTGDKDRTRTCMEMLAVDPLQGPPVHALGARLRGLDLVSNGNVTEGTESLKEAADILDGCGLRLLGSQARLEWAEAVGSKDSMAEIVPDLLQYFGEQRAGWWLQRTRRLARQIGYFEDHPHRNGHALSLREAEVVLKASVGLSNATIAEQLFLSERTIESHLRNVYKRLGLSSRVSLAAWAAEHPEEFSTGTDTAPGWPGSSSSS